MAKSQSLASVEAEGPTVVIILTPKGLQRSLVFYESEQSFEAGNQLLARISAQLMLLDNALRSSEK